MTPEEALSVALDHYQRGSVHLERSRTDPPRDRLLWAQQAAAHFAAGHLALAIGAAEQAMDEASADA